MKKEKKKNAILCVLLSLMVVALPSCTENNEMFEDIQPSKSLNQLSLIVKDNPFNAIGELHNSILLNTGDSLQSIFDNFLNKTVVNNSDIDTLLSASMDKLSNTLIATYNVKQDSVYSLIENTVSLIQTDDFLAEENTTNIRIEELIDSATCFDSLLLSIYRYEQELSYNYNLGKQEFYQSLVSVTVLKYSLLFWHDAFFNSENPWHNFVTETFVKQNISYIDTKASFKDLWGKIKNGINKATNWVKENLDHILTGIVVGAILDFGGAGAAASQGVSDPTAIAIIAGTSSIFGGLTGFTSYNLFN